MRWLRKNDSASIAARRQAMGVADGLVTSIDLEPFASAAESLVGVAVIPVSAVPVEIELGSYELADDGAVVEANRAAETVHVPLAHTEGGLTAEDALLYADVVEGPHGVFHGRRDGVLAQRQAGWSRLQMAYLSIGDEEARAP